MSDRIVADVRRFSKSTGYARFLLLTIASHIHPKAEYAYPSLDTLARETTLSKPTVIKLTKGLEALGELEVRRGHGRGHPNRYRVTIDHEVSPDRPGEDNPDPPKGTTYPDQHPPAWSSEDNIDQPKGKPSLYLLPNEKVNDLEEKVNRPPHKGQGSIDSKEVLRTSKEKTERAALDIEHVKGDDLDRWIMWNSVYGRHLLCNHDHQPGTPCYQPGRRPPRPTAET